ncbi:ABC transporter substrate-binding protein [Frankia sp. Cppng1_Ct_nod]|uniref:ABC transporter substrate-binding protein n=1 Tax=Frankia sp. Cppng1_Ct_nod TaxID=2897162 RepID=UPI001041AB4B|nr:ABC transporter substrate-binding protein [Frankia sp. Cppng1_Ct_nod]
MRHRIPLGRRPAVAVVAVVAVVLAASCGGGSADTQGTSANADCPTPGISPTTAKVGMIFPTSGAAAPQFADFRAGVDARFGVENSKGGVHGRQLTYDWANDDSNPATNLAMATGLIEKSEDFAILQASSVASGSAGYLHKNGIPVVGISAETVWSQNDNMFTWSNYLTDGPAPTTWGTFAKSQGGKKAAVLRIAFSEASAIFAQKVADSLKTAGIDVVYTDQISATGTDPASIVARIKGYGVDVLAGALTVDAFANITAAVNRAQVPLKVSMSPSGYDQAVLTKYGSQLAGTYVFVNVAPFEENLPAHKAFIAGMTSYAPQLQPPTQNVALSGWISADLFIRGLQASGACPTRQSFINGLRQVRDYDAGGLVAPAADMSRYQSASQCYTFLRVNAKGTAFDVQQPAPYCGT